MNSQATTKPLSVLHIASGDLWAGAEVQLFTLLSHLFRQEGVTVHAALLNEGELARRLRSIGIPVVVLDETRFGSAQILLQLRRLIRQIGPHVVHTHRQKENVLGSIANLLSIRAASIRTSHGASEHNHNGWRKLHKRAFHALDTFAGKHLQDRIVAVSKGLVDVLAVNFSQTKIVVIENGVDVETLRSTKRNSNFRVMNPDAVHIGIVGRLEKVKRVDLFLEMAAVLLRHEPNKSWRFHIIGDGKLRGQLQELAVKLQINDYVTFHGHRTDSAECLASLDALVMCSDHEGMPMTPLESIAVGTPVVAHDVGGLSDILSGESGGVLTRNHTGAGYAQALRTLLAANRAELITRGRARVEERFSAAKNAVRMVELYRELSG